MSSAPLLEIEDLKVHFTTDEGVVKAVDGLSLEVREGEMLGIVGESGSGKSVANMTILGLTRASNADITGRITFEGEDLLEMDDETLQRIRGNGISMIFQDPLSALHPFFKIGSQLVEAIQIHQDLDDGAARAHAIDLLERVGIPDAERRMGEYPHEFSGGMRQRVMIAMALTNDPKLLIADEPTTALDVTVQAQILELIQRLQQETGTAVIMITHDLGVVAEITHDIAVMYAGRVVERAPTAQLFAAPQHPYTWGLLRSIPRLDSPRDEELVPIEGRPPSLINRPSGCAFHPRCPYVRDAHKRVDPTLEPVAGDPGHQVACLLPPPVRTELWRRLEAGEDPQRARAAVPLGDAAE